MEQNIMAPMPGLVARVVVAVGDKVEQGQEVAVINCMKTEIPVTADRSGTVRSILVKEWDELQVGDAMVAIDAA
ncbi:MAG: pyruvate carboxylase [Desulfobulbaceae bacterium BRH_c16a]|nr:MAG: pyruvate carboxylase [Desulfobulbaceae bacterium BRH_c16a]